MTAKEFQERMLFLLRRRPFVPFDVDLTDGTRYHVRYPEAIATGGGAAGFGDEQNEIHLFDYRNTARLGPDDLRPDDPGPYGPFTIDDPFTVPGGPGPMSKDEFHARLQVLLGQRPFVPFEIEMCDGTRLPVGRPDMVAAFGKATPVYGDERGEMTFFDHRCTRAFHVSARAASA
jgi:hypothetical protein